MSAMRFGFCREQKNASLFCVCCLRVPRQRGFGRSDKCTKGRTGPVSLWYEWCSKAAVSRNPKRPAAALGYGRCRGGMESLSFMTRRMSTSLMSQPKSRLKSIVWFLNSCSSTKFTFGNLVFKISYPFLKSSFEYLYKTLISNMFFALISAECKNRRRS